MFIVSHNQTQFEIRTHSSVYVCNIDKDQRLCFGTWSEKPQTDTALSYFQFKPLIAASQDYFKRSDEVLAYGDQCDYESSISLIIEAQKDNALPIRDLRLRYQSHTIGQPAMPFAGVANHGRAPKESGGDWLIFHLSDTHSNIEVDLCIRAHASSDVLERYLILRNAGKQTVSVRHAHAASVNMPTGRWQATHLYGAWAAEFQVQCQILPIGSTIIESRNLISGARHQPTTILQRVGQASQTDGESFGLQLAWSGSWQINIEQKYDRTLRAHLGEHPHDATKTIEPTQQFATPLVILTRSTLGEEGVANNLRQYHQARTLPKLNDLRPVLYNTWEATYFDLSLDKLKQVANRARDIGVECFVVDDGWFGARRHDAAGLGDWYACSEIFPNGLQELVSYVHKLGMKFGLWFEPEMVNRDSDLYRAHPDWVLHYPDREQEEARNQLILDFGNPDVVNNIREQFITLLDNTQVDFIKWDMNRPALSPGSVAGQRIWRDHVDAVHGLMDELLKRYPQLQIQSCSAGGGRVDAAMLMRCCQVWPSDNTDAIQRIDIQEGYALTGYPISTMESWVTHELNHQTKRRHSLALRFAIAMRGVLTIGTSLEQLDKTELEQYKKLIAFYKQVRPVIHQGQLHRPAIAELEDGCSAWQYYSSDGKESYLSIIFSHHQAGQTPPWLRLKGLIADTSYALKDENGNTLDTLTGSDLMSVGIPALPLDIDLLQAHIAYVRHIHLVAT